MTGAGELVLDGDAGVAEPLEARADREEQRLDIGQLVDFGAGIVFELDAGTPHGELHLESIEALAQRGHQHRRAGLGFVLGSRVPGKDEAERDGDRSGEQTEQGGGNPHGRPLWFLLRVCEIISPHPLMSHVKLGGATTRLSTRSGEMSMRMIVQRWERSPETSVNILLFAGSRMSVFRLGLSRSEYGRRPRGRPHRMIGNSPCRGRAPAVARDLSFTGPCPGAWLPENGLNVPSCSLCRALLPGRTAGRGDLAIDGPDEAGEFTGEDRKS